MALGAVLLPGALSAETIRLASYHTELSGRGPGVILQDIRDGEAPVLATVAVIAAAGADIVLLQGLDYDASGAALEALADALAAEGADYPHRLVLRPNTGRPTGFDLDGDGRSDGPRDAQGYGRFNGAGGMALLSRFPIGTVIDHSAYLWRDLPGSAAAEVTPADALPVLRLHSVAAWDVEVLTPSGPLHLLASHASAPVFDGPEDRNGRRNGDEVRFWQLYLDAALPGVPPLASGRFAVLGTFNVDPDRGEGLRGPLRDLLGHPLLQDLAPVSARGGATTDWHEPVPGNLRVDYILPARGLAVTGAGVFWPEEGDLAEAVAIASRHRLVWVDIDG